MKFAAKSPRSIRYSLFIGVLAGLVFSGSGAFASTPIASQTQLEAIGTTVESPIDGDYVVTENFSVGPAAGDYSYVNGAFTGTFDGGGHTISGLNKPLFYIVDGNESSPATTISDLTLVAANEGVTGGGILAEVTEAGTAIENVNVNGNVNGGANVGGLVGQNNGVIADSSAEGVISGDVAVGGLAGYSSGTITNSYATDSVSGAYDVGGLVGYNAGNIANSHATVTVTGTGTSTGATGLEGVAGGLVGRSVGTITNSYANGDVTGTSYVGGLVGYSSASITNSYASNDVVGTGYVGGLAGRSSAQITTSYAEGSVTGTYSVGGLVGESMGGITASYAISTVVGGSERTGGLAGHANYVPIINSYSEGSVSGNWDVGGLVGLLFAGISNSFSGADVSGNVRIGGIAGHANYVPITNSYSEGTVEGNWLVGGLVGLSYTEISDSHSSGDVVGESEVGGISGQQAYVNIINAYTTGDITGTDSVGGLIGAPAQGSQAINSETFGTVTQNGDVITEANSSDGTPLNNPLEVLNHGLTELAFAIDTSINSGHPYLISLLCTYENACDNNSDGGETGDGGDTPTPDRPIRERVAREVREVTESRAPERIEKSVGFKNETPLSKSAPITIVEPTEKIDVARVKAVEIAPTANVKVSAKAGEALQISLKSESKEPVELWVKSPDGSWLLAGVITFDKDGKAILPPLQFKNAGDYSLVLSKPTADSAKGSAPLDQTGSVLVAVS